MPKFPNSHFYGGKTTFGGANLRKNIRRLQTTPYSALSNVRSIEAKPATVNGKLSSAALNGDAHLSSRTKRVLECLEKTALPVSSCKRQRVFEPYIPPPTTTKELQQEKDKTENVTFSSNKVPPRFPIIIQEKPPAMLEVASKFEKFKQKRLAEKLSKWTCPTCSIDNDLTDDKCSACEEPNPKKKKRQYSPEPPSLSEKQEKAAPPPSNLFSFGTPEVGSTFEKFKQKRLAEKLSKWACPTCSVDNDLTEDKCSACEEPNPEKKQKQCSPEPPVAEKQEKSVSSSLFSFETPKAVSAAFSGNSTDYKFTFSSPVTSSAPSALNINFGSPVTLPKIDVGPPLQISSKLNINFSQASTTASTTCSNGFKFGQTLPTLKQPVSTPSFGAATQPAVTQPTVTQPTVTQPTVTQPEVIQSAVIQPAVTPPSVIQPSVIQPAVTPPSVTPPSVTQSVAAQPAVTQSAVTQSAVTQSVVTQPTVIQSAVTQPTVIQPKVIQPMVTKPAVSQPTVTKPAALSSAQPLPFTFGQPSNKVATAAPSNTGFNFSQSLPPLGQPASTPSFGAATQPPTLPAQPTLFKFGQTSNNTASAGNTGFNFSQALPTLRQPAFTPAFGAATQPAAHSSVQPLPFTFGQPSNKVATAVPSNSGFNFSQSLPPLGQLASTPSFGAATQPPTLPAQPTLFKFGQTSNNTASAGNTGFNFSQTLPTLGQPASTPAFGAATQPATLSSAQPLPFTFGQPWNSASDQNTIPANRQIKKAKRRLR